MSDLFRLVGVTGVLFVTHFQHGVTGFGCSALALPFVVLLLGLHSAVPVLVILAWVTTLGIIVEAKRSIIWSEYKRMLLMMGGGLPIGIYLSDKLPETTLKLLLALFMVAVGAHGLSKSGEAPSKPSRRSLWLAKGLLPIGGMAQGAFGASGPITVFYATKTFQEKALFRVTLSLVAFSLNTVLIAQWIARSALPPDVWRVVAICLPFTILGMILGNKVHYRINENRFRVMVNTVLIISGPVLAYSCFA